MSALVQFADSSRTTREVREVPKPAVSNRSKEASFDHVVGALLENPRHVEAERLRGLEVDDEFVLGRPLYRQVARLLALEDAVNITGSLPIHVDLISPIGDQAASGDEETFVVDRGQFVPCRQRVRLAIPK